MNTLLTIEIDAGSITLVAVVLGLAYLGLVLFCLSDVLRSSSKDSVTKIIWVVVIFFAPFLGSLLYLIMGRNNKS